MISVLSEKEEKEKEKEKEKGKENDNERDVFLFYLEIVNLFDVVFWGHDVGHHREESESLL